MTSFIKDHGRQHYLHISLQSGNEIAGPQVFQIQYVHEWA